jgi:Family of unknown function (DUF6533)
MSTENYDVMAREAFAVAYVTIACATVLLWDAVITFSDEVSFLLNLSPRSVWSHSPFFFPNRLIGCGR